ncbi:aromatic ring-hydroxylating dioxygenase subunit alpha [Ammoniphilus sp. 3BR4]|uniref:aromatic ring-hydroxylating oxygenase subunit alpha n=1 Tax=Ammoniphilus sp. 3BR4 TaxID=3158265 RepID=UPI0034677877
MIDVKQLVIDNKQENKFKVHRSTFVDPEIFKLEKEKIFSNCWIYVGHESEIPNSGDYVTRKVAGRALIFSRDAQGRFHVLLNTCTHRGALVCREEKGNAKTFVCCYHAWSFKNDGELIGVPHRDAYGENFDRSEFNLHEPRSESYKGFVFVNFNPQAESLEDYLGGAKEYLDLVADQSPTGMEIVGGTHKYSIRANWKLLGENSIDGYHAAHNHKTYFTFLKDLNLDVSAGLTDGIGKSLGNGHTVMQYNAPWGRPVAKWTPIWGDEAKAEIEEIRTELEARCGSEKAKKMAESNRNLWIFPNLIINDIMSLTIRTFDPIAPDYMEVTAWAMGPKGEAENLRARRLDYFLTFLGPAGFATPDDVESLEVCQMGFSTMKEVQWQDISRGMHREQPLSTDELQMRGFWRHWVKVMAGQASGSKVLINQ